MGAVSSWLCCPCRCLFCGILSCALSVLACVLLTAGVAALTLYLLFRPHLIHATATRADLDAFTLTPKDWLLRYNLSLAVALRNPNARIALRYRHLAADAYYDGQRFAHADLPDLFQGAGGDTKEVAPPPFAGEHPLVGGVAAASFRREAAEGARFSIHVKLTSRLKLRVWKLKLPGPKATVDCPLVLQRRNATAGAPPPPQFKPIDCAVSF